MNLILTSISLPNYLMAAFLMIIGMVSDILIARAESRENPTGALPKIICPACHTITHPGHGRPEYALCVHCAELRDLVALRNRETDHPETLAPLGRGQGEGSAIVPRGTDLRFPRPLGGEGQGEGRDAVANGCNVTLPPAAQALTRDYLALRTQIQNAPEI